MSEWISVDEQTPSETDDYLTYGEIDGIPMQGVNTWFQTRGHFSCETRSDRCITHWMPLPECP